MKRVMSLGKKYKLNPWCLGPYEILKHVRSVSYALELPIELARVYPMIHESVIKKCTRHPLVILALEVLGVYVNLSNEEVLDEISHRQVKRLKNKEIIFVKVLWWNRLVETFTWEAKTDMMSCYPYLIPSTPIQI